MRQTTAIVSTNVRRESALIARRAVHHCAPLHLRAGFEAYDFAIPFILREEIEELEETRIDPSKLEAFGVFSLDQL